MRNHSLPEQKAQIDSSDGRLFDFSLKALCQLPNYNKSKPQKMSTITNMLVPGGLGFIGSHTVVHIIEQTSAKVVIVDDLSNCFDDVLSRIKLILSSKIPSEQIEKRVRFHQGNILDLPFLDGVFKQYLEKGEPIDAIMHFAAKKAIGESFAKPMLYYENNVIGSMNLFKLMEKYTDCKNFIFSSTAGVYGDKDNCTETDHKLPGSPYGESKACVEMLLASLCRVHKDWRVISLRYFNPCGAHESYLLGDEPYEYPNNLFPFIQEVIIQKRQRLTVFGNNYNTPDGTCVRDYIHITDLANGHVMAMNRLPAIQKNYQVYNLGTGCGYSVLQVVKGFQRAMQKPLNYVIGQPRHGDVAKLVANIEKGTKQLGWRVTKSLDDMCRDSVIFITRRDKFNKEKKAHQDNKQ